MAYELDIIHSGNAPTTTLASDITDSSDTINLTSGTGYPSPTGTQVAYITLAPGTSNEEKIYYGDRSGGTLTECVRGQDGTTARQHAAGTEVKHGFTAREADEANQVVRKFLGSLSGNAKKIFRINDAGTDVEAGGAVDHGDAIVSRPILKDVGEEVHAHGNTGSTETIDLENGNVHTCTLDANCTFTFSNPTASGDSCSFTLILTQDGTGSRAVTWPASVDWPGGTPPILSTTASARDKLIFETRDGGTTWEGNLVGKGYA